ncbi:MAG: glutathione S-transferase family protein [Pseudomonadota bacterium]
MNRALRVYGVPNSQPVRAVLWACLIEDLPFELILTSQNRDAKTPAFLAQVNPRGTIPAIDDDGFVLWESHAILVYLAEKHDWHDLWPTDPQARARVNQYLHFHHRNTRELVINWSRTLWPSVFKKADPSPGWLARNTFPGLTNNAEVRAHTLEIIDGWLQRTPFIAATASPSLADIVAYEELGQNQPRFANCEDYTPYPAIEAWLERMLRLPHHDTAHEIWRLVGDINAIEGGMKTIARANRQAAATLSEAGAALAAAGT